MAGRWSFSAEEMGGDAALELDHLLGATIDAGQVDLLREAGSERLWLSVKDGGAQSLGAVEGAATGARLGSRLTGAGGICPAGATPTCSSAGASLTMSDTHWVLVAATHGLIEVEFGDGHQSFRLEPVYEDTPNG